MTQHVRIGETALIRDIHSKAILNTDKAGLNDYLMKRVIAKKQQDEVASLKKIIEDNKAKADLNAKKIASDAATPIAGEFLKSISNIVGFEVTLFHIGGVILVLILLFFLINMGGKSNKKSKKRNDDDDE